MNLGKQNKIEDIVKVSGVDVYSSTIVKLLINRKLILSSIVFDTPPEYIPPESCIYCIKKYKEHNPLKNLPEKIDPNFMCKKHKGIYSLLSYRPAKIELDNTYLLVKNWLFIKKDNMIIEVYLPHVSISVNDFNVFLLEKNTIQNYDRILENAINITRLVLTPKSIWAHVADRRFIILNKIHNYTYKWNIWMYDLKIPDISSFLQH